MAPLPSFLHSSEEFIKKTGTGKATLWQYKVADNIMPFWGAGMTVQFGSWQEGRMTDSDVIVNVDTLTRQGDHIRYFYSFMGSSPRQADSRQPLPPLRYPVHLRAVESGLELDRPNRSEYGKPPPGCSVGGMELLFDVLLPEEDVRGDGD